MLERNSGDWRPLSLLMPIITNAVAIAYVSDRFMRSHFSKWGETKLVWLITDDEELHVAGAIADGTALWLSPDVVERATGWQLKPEGLCRGELCVPIPAQRTNTFLRDDKINIAEFWRLMGWPVVSDDSAAAWMLGQGASARSAALESLEAPDFNLPDLDDVPHKLSGERSKKVFLATWASW